MVVTFCGHSDFLGNDEMEHKILSLLEKAVGDRDAEMYLGGYGGFDQFAYRCCQKYKQAHSSVRLVFVTPYRSQNFLNTRLAYHENKYDAIVYPSLENRPARYALLYRNQYMIDCADIVFAYICRSFGGAATTYQYALKKGKPCWNLALS